MKASKRNINKLTQVNEYMWELNGMKYEKVLACEKCGKPYFRVITSHDRCCADHCRGLRQKVIQSAPEHRRGYSEKIKRRILRLLQQSCEGETEKFGGSDGRITKTYSFIKGDDMEIMEYKYGDCVSTVYGDADVVVKANESMVWLWKDKSQWYHPSKLVKVDSTPDHVAILVEMEAEMKMYLNEIEKHK